MKRKNKQNNKHILLRLISLIFGFMCWYVFMHQQDVDRQVRIPISFHNIPQNMAIIAPEIAAITVRGKRIDIHALDPNTNSFHIDATSLKKGNNQLLLSADKIFLPNQVSLLNSSPSTILVYMHEKQKTA